MTTTSGMDNGFTNIGTVDIQMESSATAKSVTDGVANAFQCSGCLTTQRTFTTEKVHH